MGSPDWMWGLTPKTPWSHQCRISHALFDTQIILMSSLDHLNNVGSKMGTNGSDLEAQNCPQWFCPQPVQNYCCISWAKPMFGVHSGEIVDLDWYNVHLLRDDDFLLLLQLVSIIWVVPQGHGEFGKLLFHMFFHFVGGIWHWVGKMLLTFINCVFPR